MNRFERQEMYERDHQVGDFAEKEEVKVEVKKEVVEPKKEAKTTKTTKRTKKKEE